MQIVPNADLSGPAASLTDKLSFLSQPSAYGRQVGQVQVRQTHMSWVFLCGDLVWKMKKPVRYAFLDFSTLQARLHDCEEELRLNRRLARDVYLGLMPVLRQQGQLRLGRMTYAHPAHQAAQVNEVQDWLVVMRRLPSQFMLDEILQSAGASAMQWADVVERLARLLARFYRDAPRVDWSASRYLAQLWAQHDENRAVLLRPEWRLHGSVDALDQFEDLLRQHTPLLAQRAADRRIRDGHGDLRPEHVCLLPAPLVIDCLEFNPQLRVLDPVDELSYLGLECAMAGATWIGPRLLAQYSLVHADTPPAGLVRFYTAYRALLRARLALAHFLDPQVHQPQRWRPMAQRYLRWAWTAMQSTTELPPGT